MSNPRGRPRGQRIHGTDGGYQQHVADGTPKCTPCKVAHAVTGEHARNKGRCAPGLGWPLEARRP